MATTPKNPSPVQTDLFSAGLVGVRRAAGDTEQAKKTLAALIGTDKAATLVNLTRAPSSTAPVKGLFQQLRDRKAAQDQSVNALEAALAPVGAPAGSTPPRAAVALGIPRDAAPIVAGAPANPNAPNARRIVGKLHDIRFHSTKDDAYIFRIQPLGTNAIGDLVTVKGTGFELAVGQELEVEGVMKKGTNPKYPNDFFLQAASVHEVMPVSAEGILKLLQNGFVKGIGPKTAEELVKKFGERLFDVAEFEPSKLLAMRGIGDGKAKALITAIQKKRALPRIMAFLAEMGLGQGMSNRVFRALGTQAVPVIKADPYKLTAVPLIGFSRADEVARKLGVPFDSVRRIEASMEAVLVRHAERGSTAVPLSVMKQDMAKLLRAEDPSGRWMTVDAARIELVLNEAIATSPKVVQRSIARPTARSVSSQSLNDPKTSESPVPTDPIECLSLTEYVRAEHSIARRLALLANTPTAVRPSTVDFSSARFAHLDPSQRKAALTTLGASVSVITGRPGCGKTTLTKSILDVLEEAGLKIMQVAPTGKAAKRMSEVTGRPSATVHRALKSLGGAGGFLHNENNPLDAEVICCDEWTMTDTKLMDAFLRAVKPGTMVIMVGDVDQLPSISAGNVLADTISSGCVPVSVLDTIHRQAGGGNKLSSITANCHRILSGEMPLCAEDLCKASGLPSGSYKEDFQIVRFDESMIPPLAPGESDDAESRQARRKAAMVAQTLSLFTSLQAEGIADENIQLLSALRQKDELGCNNLNRALKQLINPTPDAIAGEPIQSFTRGKFDNEMTFSVGDRIMYTENNADLGIFNGDVGYIDRIDRKERSVTCVFDDGDSVVDLDFDDFDDVDLSFATTVHKSQGSEYNAVIMPVANSHGIMMDRNLLTTAWSRGKGRVIVCGDTDNLKNWVKKANSTKRMTGLQDEIAEQFQALKNYRNSQRVANGEFFEAPAASAGSGSVVAFRRRP